MPLPPKGTPNHFMNTAAPVIVDIRRLSKSYRRGSQVIPVLEDISLTIAESEFLALMGPSGSGKSTLLNLIAGLDRADSGTIRVGGVDISALSEIDLAAWRAAHVGFIFQFYNLIPVLTAFENVELPLVLTDLSRRQRREHAALRVGIEHAPGGDLVERAKAPYAKSALLVQRAHADAGRSDGVGRFRGGTTIGGSGHRVACPRLAATRISRTPSVRRRRAPARRPPRTRFARLPPRGRRALGAARRARDNGPAVLMLARRSPHRVRRGRVRRATRMVGRGDRR